MNDRHLRYASDSSTAATSPHSATLIQLLPALACLAGLLVTTSRTAYAGPYIQIEAVNDYSQCNGPSLTNPIADAQGFQDWMVHPYWNYAGFQRAANPYFDFAVWTSDFYDPQNTGSPDTDHLYFDKPGTAISYYAGHGSCDTGDFTPYVFCNRASECNSPPAGTTFPAVCRRHPGDYVGVCSYTKYNRAILLGNCTSGPAAGARGGRVDYSSQYGWVKWGESPFHTGNWANAGSTGGTNVVVLHSSCGELSHRGHENFNLFAGVHLFATVLRHTGDTAMVIDRGVNFAAQSQNPYSSVADGWINSMHSINHSNNWCQSLFTGQSYGGGLGVNGCGGHVITAMGATAAEASAHLNENWYQVRKDVNDGRGKAYWANRYTCNYDCWTWSMGLY